MRFKKFDNIFFIFISCILVAAVIDLGAVSLSDLTVKDFQVINEDDNLNTPEQQLLSYFSRIMQKKYQHRKQVLDSITTISQFDDYRFSKQKDYQHALGKFPEKCPLDVKFYGTTDCGEYTVSRITFESMPGYLVTANLYSPVQLEGPYPLVLSTTGHWWGRGSELDGKGFDHVQILCANLARHGCLVLAIDPFGQGERKMLFDPSMEHQSKMGRNKHQHIVMNLQLHLTGHNLTQMFVWDCIRGIDVLCNLKNADTTRIAVVGASGGGSQAQFVAAVDPRIKAVVPVCSNWQQGDKHDPGIGNVDGEQNIPGRIKYELDLADLLYMSNARDVLLMNATGDTRLLSSSVNMYNEILGLYDRIFPIVDGRSISYHLIGAPHSFNREFRETLYNWLDQKFVIQDAPALEVPVKQLPAQDINITQSGNLEELKSETLLSINATFAKEIVPASQDMQNRIQTVLKLNNIPEITSTKQIDVTQGDDFKIEKLVYQVDELWIPAILLTPEHFNPNNGRTLIYIHERGKANGFENIINFVKQGYQVFASDTRGFNEYPDLHPEQSPGNDNPDFIGYDIIFSPDDYDLDFNAFGIELEEPLFGMRLKDVLVGINYLRSRSDVSKHALEICGFGDGAMLALHAAVMCNDIEHIGLYRLPVSFRELAIQPYGAQSPYLFVHNVLSFYDVPDLLKSLGNRSVFVSNVVDANRHEMNLDLVRKVYSFDDSSFSKSLTLTNVDQNHFVKKFSNFSMN